MRTTYVPIHLLPQTSYLLSASCRRRTGLGELGHVLFMQADHHHGTTTIHTFVRASGEKPNRTRPEEMFREAGDVAFLAGHRLGTGSQPRR